MKHRIEPTQNQLFQAWSGPSKPSSWKPLTGLIFISCSVCLSCTPTHPQNNLPQSSVNQHSTQSTAVPSVQITPEAALASAKTTGSKGLSFSLAQFKHAIAFDFEGENGKRQANPAAKSVGYPCGVPSNYSWKYGTRGTSNIAKAVANRGPQLAGAAYNQVYNACGTRKLMPNARVEFTNLVVQVYSKRLKKWTTVVNQPIGGAAFAEDFSQSQATKADLRTESQGYKSVRSGIGNAALPAGGSTGRSAKDGPVGFNFHGFTDRFKLNWTDSQAIIVSQAMRCIPHNGTSLKDCEKLGYVANVGLDSWASTTSPFSNFSNHGGVSGGRFKPVTTQWQIFTNYIGPKDLVRLSTPPVPRF